MVAKAKDAPYLKVRNLTKNFGDFTALRDISLDVMESEFVCFLGPSGCGKTTLLRAIAGLDIQTAGTIEQGGHDISALPPSERDFGIVFQSYALFPNLTVTRNVAYGLENRKLPRDQIKTRVAELLDLVGLSDQGDKYPAQLSGGQQQRVALARALATWPGLLLLDEPLSALDAKVRAYLRHEVRQLQRRLGITTVMVTHDQEEALIMADRIVVMDHGIIVQVGTPIDVYRDPATRFVADFVGTMNFLSAVALGPGRVRLGRIEIDCADGVDGIDEGAAVIIGLRPEDLAVRDVGRDTPNAAAARVVELEFLGAFYRATLAIDGLDDQPVTADISPALVGDLGIREGAELTVRFPEDRLRVFAER